MRRDHHETKLNSGKTFQCMGKRIWTHNHGLDISCTLWYFQEEAINNFYNGKKVYFQWAVALIVFHLHLLYKVMVSCTYQLFLSHFLLWNVSNDLNTVLKSTVFLIIFLKFCHVNFLLWDKDVFFYKYLSDRILKGTRKIP